jgi:hypothetical protein
MYIHLYSHLTNTLNFKHNIYIIPTTFVEYNDVLNVLKI